jgi:phage anti-repressor protein
MDELITIEHRDGQHIVNARDLWERLEIGRDFSTWFKDRVSEYGFEHGTDYLIDSPNLGNQKGRGGDRRTRIYRLTLDMAKELCMVERNEIGRKFRKYFIEVEKRFKDMARPALTASDVKQSRKDFTTVLIDHGVKGPNIGIATNYQYAKLFGTNAKGLKAERNPAAKTARELLTDIERRTIVAHEGLAALGAENIQANGLEPMKYCIREAADLTAAMIDRTNLIKTIGG